MYVNGTEMVRDNLPAGTLTAATYSSTKVTAADGIDWKTFTIPSSALVAGDNVIAAEVHQDSKSDTRGVFDLELQSTVASTAPIVTITAPASGSFATTPTTLSGLCTTAAGTVTVNITGTQPTIVTAPCVANDWSVEHHAAGRSVQRHRIPDRREQPDRHERGEHLHGGQRRARRHARHAGQRRGPRCRGSDLLGHVHDR